MAKRLKTRRTVGYILASTSDVLFPAALGEASVTVDSADCDGDTPLHVMVWRNDLHAVQSLLRAGADVNAVGDMGETPLHVAVGQANIAIIAALLNAGARTDMRSEFDETAFERALKKGGEIAKLLRRMGSA